MPKYKILAMVDQGEQNPVFLKASDTLVSMLTNIYSQEFSNADKKFAPISAGTVGKKVMDYYIEHVDPHMNHLEADIIDALSIRGVVFATALKMAELVKNSQTEMYRNPKIEADIITMTQVVNLIDRYYSPYSE